MTWKTQPDPRRAARLSRQAFGRRPAPSCPPGLLGRPAFVPWWRRSLFASFRGVANLAVFLWEKWRRLLPLYIAVAIQLLAFLLSFFQGGAQTALVIAVLCGAGLWRLLRGRNNWTWSPESPRTAWTWGSLWWPAGSFATGAGTLLYGAMMGAGPPLPGVLGLWAIAAGVPWWWHHRIRPAEPVIDRLATWTAEVAASTGPLPDSWLTDYKVNKAGWSAMLWLPPGPLTTEIATSTQVRRRIAKAYKLPVASIVLELLLGGEEDRLELTVLSGDNPLVQPQVFTGPTLDKATGWCNVGIRPDGSLAKWRLFIPKSGVCMGMIFGTTGAGKSGLLNVLLTELRHSGIAETWVADPEEGESVPDWQDHVGWFAGTLPEIRRMLQAAERVMNGRKKRRASGTWVDSLGRERRGRGFFEPTPEEPMLGIVVDEAPDVLADPECKRILKLIGRKGRKLGVFAYLVAQVPALTEMGGDNTLRSVISSFNIAAFRTGDKLSKLMGAAKLPMDPYDLPETWPDGSSTAGLGYIAGSGGDRVSPQRAYYVEDPYAWATTGTPARLEAEAQKDAGKDYVTWRDRRDLGEDDEMPQVVSLSKSSDGTIRSRILEFLKGRAENEALDADATTAVISDAIEASKGATSQELGRMERERGLLVGPSTGNRPATWRFITEAEREEQEDLEEAS